MRRLFLAALTLPVLAGCSGSLQGPPAFVQTYGTVDAPCAAPNHGVDHCLAHVYLVNQGGAGNGVVTIAVPVAAAGAAASPAHKTTSEKCGGYIPDTAAGAVVDLTCAFNLAAGQAVAGPPILLGMNFTAAVQSGAGSGDTLGLVNFGLAVAAGLIALIALALAITGRSGTRPARGRPVKANEDDEDW